MKESNEFAVSYSDKVFSFLCDSVPLWFNSTVEIEPLRGNTHASK
jgi:hypothetical protein